MRIDRALVLGTLLFAACASSTPQEVAVQPASPPAPEAAKPVPVPAPQAPAAWASALYFTQACNDRLAGAQAAREAIRRGQAPDVLEAHNRLLMELGRAAELASLVSNTHPDKEVRTLAEDCEKRVQAMSAELHLDRGLFDALTAVPAAELSPDAARFRERELRVFRRSGVDRDEETRGKLKALHAEMVDLGQGFSRNIREGTTTIEVTPADLKGMPEDFLKSHAPNARGKVVLNTDYPDLFPIQTYAVKEETRKRLVVEFLNRGFPKNEALLTRLVAARAEYASLLGYPSWAEYQAEDKMVGKASEIEKFIEQVAKITRPRMERELKELLARKTKDARGAKAIEQWDRFYYVETVRREKFGFDSLEARPYFEFTRVLEGMLGLYGELFSLTFQRVEGAEVWDPSVITYDALEDGQTIGRFYLDMHPRDGKYSHAAMFPVVTGTADGELPQAALVCNFPDPKNGVALLEHDKVITLFHEFGHLIHQLLARSSHYITLAGISTEWDFVEAPSQLLEEWTWDAKVLQRFAKHVETGAPIPEELVQKLKASSEFGKGTQVMRQLFYASLSYYLHARSPKSLSLASFTQEMTRRFSPYPYVKGTHLYAGFGHLEGYSSMYYTYQWSLVLAKDIFTRFEQNGLFDQGTAREYRDKILKLGGSRDARVLVSDFLGRDPSLEAYQRWLERD